MLKPCSLVWKCCPETATQITLQQAWTFIQKAMAIEPMSGRFDGDHLQHSTGTNAVTNKDTDSHRPVRFNYTVLAQTSHQVTSNQSCTPQKPDALLDLRVSQPTRQLPD